MSWKAKLLPSEAQFMQEIVDQVPEMVRNLFTGILEKLAGGSSTQGSRRFVIVHSSNDINVTHTDDESMARRYAGDESGDFFVVDTQKGLWITSGDEADDLELEEAS